MAIKTVLFFFFSFALSSAVLADAVVPGEFTDPTNVRKLTDDQQGWWYVAPDHLKYPYISTYYITPTVKTGEKVTIPFFVTDYDNSKIRFGDESFRFTVKFKCLGADGKVREETLENVPSGDGAFEFAPFPEGEYEFCVWAVDAKGIESHRVWHKFRVMTPEALEILPRESDIARWRGSNRGERQTLAANVDVVMVVQALGDREVDYARIARSAVVAADCGAHVAVVLTKADRAGAEGMRRDVAAVREVLGDDVPLSVTCAGAERGADATELRHAARELGVPFGEQGVRDLVPEGVVAIVLGESGAGKSTLLNALLGRDVLETGAVRASDDAGRHTTVARRMVSLAGAGIIVDEPGLRSLPLVGHERGLAKIFPDISGQARHCRFRNCTHTHEPGCAVLGEADELGYAGRRLEAYLALAHEMRASRQTIDPDVVI